MHDSVTNYINAKGLKSRISAELMQGFVECYIDLKKKGFIARLLKLDNEISKNMVKLTKEDKGLDYQVAAPGDHCLMPAEQAIGMFKNHFIAILSGTDLSFWKQAWYHILEQAVITLNTIRPSQLNPIYWHIYRYMTSSISIAHHLLRLGAKSLYTIELMND